MTIQEKYARYKLTAISDSLISFWSYHYNSLPQIEKIFYRNLLENQFVEKL